jgi:D-aspartate ligase
VFQTGVNLMRDLSRRGVRAVGVDSAKDHVGFRSIYGESYLCPNPESDPRDWVEYMQALSKRLGQKPVLIPASDLFASSIGQCADSLADHFIFSRVGSGLQAALATKEQQYALAKEHGMPCPRTEYIRSLSELREFVATAQFPCLLKPKHQRDWEALPEANPLHGRKLVTADTSEELLSWYQSAETARPEAIVQEIIAGPDDAKYCYLCVYAQDGRRLGHCVVREFRAFPVLFGSASIVQPVIDQEIETVCDRFLREINYVGICEIEVKRDTRNGMLLLIEVNPRFSGTGDCSIYTGVDLGWLHYLDLIGVGATAVEASRFDFRHITLGREIPAAVKYLEGGLITWRELVSSYRMPLEFYDFDMRDWRVTSGTLKYCMRTLGGAVLRRVGLRR